MTLLISLVLFFLKKNKNVILNVTKTTAIIVIKGLIKIPVITTKIKIITSTRILDIGIKILVANIIGTL